MSKHRCRNTDRDRIQAVETGDLIIAHDRKTDRMYEVKTEDNSIWSLDDGKRIGLKESFQLLLALTPQAFRALGILIKEDLFGGRKKK